MTGSAFPPQLTIPPVFCFSLCLRHVFLPGHPGVCGRTESADLLPTTASGDPGPPGLGCGSTTGKAEERREDWLANEDEAGGKVIEKDGNR